MSLDKKAKLAKNRLDQQEAKMAEAEKLNPSFPYKMEVFPYDFFGYESFIRPPEDTTSSDKISRRKVDARAG